MTATFLPIFYSFRRCPYAMRARLALKVCNIPVRLREIVLKDKPEAMLAISPKGTVPVLLLNDNSVIDESLEIMLWAFTQAITETAGSSEAQAWLQQSQAMITFIQHHDSEFKPWLDKYKYADRHPELDQQAYRAQAEKFISQLEEKLTHNNCLFDNQPKLADYAIFPFIRQFAGVDKAWFAQCPYPKTREWLARMTVTPLFTNVMQKYPIWKTEQQEVLF